MGGMDFMFGGSEETDNPMRFWAQYGPTAVSSYYDQAILDAQTSTGQYWGVWKSQMKAVSDLYNKGQASWEVQQAAWDKQYSATLSQISGQRDILNSQRDQQFGNINDQFNRAIGRVDDQADDAKGKVKDEERKGRAQLNSKAFSTGLIGASAAAGWGEGVTDMANEARDDIDETRNNAVSDYEMQRSSSLTDLENRYQAGMLEIDNATNQLDASYADASAQKAMALTQFDTNWTQMMYAALGGAPIGVDATNELTFRKAQELYGTPWETYAQPIQNETSGMFFDTLLPAGLSALGTAFLGPLGGMAGGAVGGMFGNLFGGGAPGVSVGAYNPSTSDWQVDVGGEYYSGLSDLVGDWSPMV